MSLWIDREKEKFVREGTVEFGGQKDSKYISQHSEVSITSRVIHIWLLPHKERVCAQ